MRVGVVHTVGSVCRCAEALASGLAALGHEALLENSAAIELCAAELAEHCDLVVDHTDTFRGSGLLRFVVRSLLEARGARLVGSDSRASLLADDKIAAKARLAEAGVPTVPGATAVRPDWEPPPWLRPPYVVKPAFEHMSRGLCVAASEAEARARVAEILAATVQPAVVEAFVPGREIGVCVLGGRDGLEVLPPVEWRLKEGPGGILSASFKREEPPEDREDLFAAELTAEPLQELTELALTAFRTLDLRDYARFDVRLSPGGTPYFLEANVTPSLESREALATSAALAGLDYPSLVSRLLESAAARHSGWQPDAERTFRVELPSGRLDIAVPPGVHFPPASTVELAKLLDVRPGEDILELGCGCGLLSLAALQLGARRAVATDLDPKALAATEENARRNGLSDRLETRAGSWYEAVEGTEGRFHVVIATPPQTPGPHSLGPRWGGPDGTRHLRAAVEGATRHLAPSSGRLWLLALSTANLPRVRSLLAERFEEVKEAGATDRAFTSEEYDAVCPGLFAHLQELRRSGRAEFRELGAGRYAFRNLYFRAARPRAAP